MSTATIARTERRDIHAEITAKLIAAIEADPGRPTMPWRRHSKPLFMPENALTKKPYNGINIVSLWVSAEVAGYDAPVWATYRQWSEIGAQVRKGEKSSLVVFYRNTRPSPMLIAPTTTASAVSLAPLTCSTPRRSTDIRFLMRRSPSGPSTALRPPTASLPRPAHSSNTVAIALSIVLRPIPSTCRMRSSSAVLTR